MRRTPSAVLLLLGALAACRGPADAPSAEPSAPDAAVAPPVTVPTVPSVFIDLAAEADRAHVRRLGPVIVPGGPGWSRVTQLADRGPWPTPKEGDEAGWSWLEGIGGTLWFPVGAEGEKLRTVELWLRPIRRGQYVSIFVDEEEVTTMRLDGRARRYQLNLPTQGLAPGEHSLRFWFRFTRFRGKKRTPAALGAVRFLPEGEPPALPEKWSGEFDVAGVSGPALYAGPPTAWSYYLLPPVGARLFARAAVREGEPVDFVVRVDVDGQPSQEALRLTVQPRTAAEIDVDLARWAGQPIRLTLETEAGQGAIERAAWVEPTILRPGRPRTTMPPVRNLVVWSVDGLRSDRVGLGRGGDRAATPNLDLLAREGAAAADVWSGGASATDGHRRLLHPHPERPALPTLFAAAGRRVGLINASEGIDDELASLFSTRDDLRGAGDAGAGPLILRELDSWLDARGRDPFFIYIASVDPAGEAEDAPGYARFYQRSRPIRGGEEPLSVRRERRDRLARYDGRVSAADYWIGQLMAVLQSRGVADDTVVVVTGSVGRVLLDEASGHGLVPALLQVPLVVWHPALRNEGPPRPVIRGGDLADVSRTLLGFAGIEAPAGWPGYDMSTSLFHGLPLAPRPSHARQGNLVAARFGDWLLRGAGSRDLRLWDLADDPSAREELGDDRPIALRTLRDSMQNEN